MKCLSCYLLFVPLIISAQNDQHDKLRTELDSIRYYDQVHRDGLDAIAAAYANDTVALHKRLKEHWGVMRRQDSINFIKVENIINEHGWLSTEEIGEAGNSTLFLVIQHADIISQEKFLPKMQKAVNDRKARAADLALLEDRIAIYHGRRQKYGSQVAWDILSNKHYVLPLEDPDNVDTRRSAVGLSPLAEYLTLFDIVWDIEQYKRDLPEIELRFKTKKH